MSGHLVSGEVAEQFLRACATVAVARFAPDGELLAANDRFLSLLPPGCSDGPLPALVVEGQRDEVRAALAGEVEPPPVVRLARPGHDPATLQATWARVDDDLVLIGEAPVAGLEESRAALARLDSQVAALTRDNAEKLDALERALTALREEHEALEEARRRIESLTREDVLTGVANRRRLQEFIEYEAARAERQKTPLAVILVDLDEFSEVNEVYGHAAGDDVLRSTARCLREAVRGTDLVGRWGGEQFLLVLPATDGEQARTLAERLLVKLRERPVGFRRQPVTGSFGVTDWQGVDSVNGLVGRAGEALREAKRRGRDQVRVR